MESTYLTVKDRRKATRQTKNPALFSVEAFEIACAVTGVDLGPETHIILCLTDEAAGDKAKQKGYMRQVGPDAYIIKVRVRKQPVWADRHYYVLNNTLLHELRHVAQAQACRKMGLNFGEIAATELAEHGYWNAPHEVDARNYGRLADHTGTKDTGDAGKALGDLAWPLRFGIGDGSSIVETAA